MTRADPELSGRGRANMLGIAHGEAKTAWQLTGLSDFRKVSAASGLRARRNGLWRSHWDFLHQPAFP